MKTLGEKIRENKAYVVVMIFGLAMAAYHLISTQILLQAAKPHLNTLGFALTLVFLWEFVFNKGKLQRLVPLILALLALACTGYVQIFWEELENRAYFNTPVDLVIGVMIIILVLEATRRNFGLILPLLTLLIVLYPFVGKYFPEPFRCQALDLDQTISNLSIGIQNGIYGIVLPTSANYIFLFVLFGALLQAMGGTKFFMLLARLVASRVQGGPGIMDLVGNSLVGSITGSAAANVAITGSFSIPLMKKVGYLPKHAAAIEAAASNGGQISHRGGGFQWRSDHAPHYGNRCLRYGRYHRDSVFNDYQHGPDSRFALFLGYGLIRLFPRRAAKYQGFKT
jgi:TRAP-type uncharacterized transport system fused permease subunit